jgi:hypothetical protein
MTTHRILFLICLVTLISCGGTTPSGKSIPKSYAEFKLILGEQHDAKTTSIAEFSKDDEYGDKISLGEGVKLFLDNTLLDLNSEVYHQYNKEEDTSVFAGNHKWVIALADGTKKEYPFEAKPFRITSEIPATVGKEDLVITCNAISKTDHVFMMLNGDFSENSEKDLEIIPGEGKFTIPASFWKTVDPIQCSMWFNISTEKEIKKDDFFVGGAIEATRVTKFYEIKVVH